MAAFVEIQDDLAGAVEAHWRQKAALTGVAPYPRIAADVWDLLRGQHPPLQQFAQKLPCRCLVIVAAGSPCGQLTWAGAHQGQQGLCGPDSVLFFAVPTIAWALTQMRPDVRVHVVVENAGSMLRVHRDTISAALNITDDRAVSIDSAAWAHMPRKRLFFGTMAPYPHPLRPARRSAPWDYGYSPRIDGEVPPHAACSRTAP